jgi:hypothetical protein
MSKAQERHAGLIQTSGEDTGLPRSSLSVALTARRWSLLTTESRLLPRHSPRHRSRRPADRTPTRLRRARCHSTRARSPASHPDSLRRLRSRCPSPGNRLSPLHPGLGLPGHGESRQRYLTCQVIDQIGEVLPQRLRYSRSAARPTRDWPPTITGTYATAHSARKPASSAISEFFSLRPTRRRGRGGVWLGDPPSRVRGILAGRCRRRTWK